MDMGRETDKNIQDCAAVIRKKRPGFAPKVAVVLGSGLSAVADLMKEEALISYTELPGFPRPTVAGHEGSLRLGTVEGVPAAFLKGRAHLYEGVGADPLKVMIRTLKTLGTEILFLTNAAGSLRHEYGPGSVVAISDHINLTGVNPLAGPNEDEWGPRFPPMGDAWDPVLRATLIREAKADGAAIGEGVYAQFMGPTFETPAEIRMAKAIGADLVGMSTVAENIIARHCGLKCVGASAVTNLAAGLGDEPLDHEHTLKNARLAEDKMAMAVRGFIRAAGAGKFCAVA